MKKVQKMVPVKLINSLTQTVGTVLFTIDAIRKHVKFPRVYPNPINVTNGISSMVPRVSSSSGAASVGNSMKFFARGNYLHLQLAGAQTEQWVAMVFSKDQKMVNSQ